MKDEQMEELERLLGYYEAHGALTLTQPPLFWIEDAVKLMRDLLPEWSAFKDAS